MTPAEKVWWLLAGWGFSPLPVSDLEAMLEWENQCDIEDLTLANAHLTLRPAGMRRFMQACRQNEFDYCASLRAKRERGKHGR